MAKTKRKHLAALAAMTEAGVINNDIRHKVEEKQVHGENARTEDCDPSKADANIVTVAGQSLKQQANGASSSELQEDAGAAAKSTRTVQHLAIAGAKNGNPLLEYRKQRIIIKIPPLPAKIYTKRQKVAGELCDHVTESRTDLEAEHKGTKNEDMEDSVASKRRKFGVDVLKKSVNSLLADIDNTFSKVMLKFGDFRKEKVVTDESRDLEKLVSGAASPCELPRSTKLENDSEIPTAAVIASAGACSTESPYGSSVHSGAGHEAGHVPRNCEETAGPVVAALVAEETGALGNPGPAGEVVAQKTGIRKKKAKGWRGTKKPSSFGQQTNVKTGKEEKNVKQNEPALHGRAPHKQLCEGAPGNVHIPESEPAGISGTHIDLVASNTQRSSLNVRSLRSRKGTALMGPGDLPVQKRRRLKKMTNDMVVAQPSGDEQCFVIQEDLPAEGMTSCAPEKCSGQRHESGHSGTTPMVPASGLGGRSLLVGGQNSGSESTAQDEATTSYIGILKCHSGQGIELGLVQDTSQSGNLETLRQKSKLLNLTPKVTSSPSPRPSACSGALSTERKIDIVITKLKADGGLNAFLRARGLEQLVPVFEAQKVDESSLLQLTMESLKQMGIHALGPRRKLMSAISSLC